MKKKLCLLLSIITIIGSLYVPVFANDSGITPYLNNTSSADLVFNIDSTGLAVSTVTLIGYDGVTTHAEISTKIQKKHLIFFWKDVDIGYPDNTYTATINGTVGIDEAEFQLSSKGTYRNLTTVTVYGTGGAADVLEFEIEYKYE